MEACRIDKLAEVVKGRLSEPSAPAVAFTDVSTDSRTVKAGDCFFAIRGEIFDGHEYVQRALEAGAYCAVVCDDYEGGGCLVRVKDTTTALGDLARWYRLERDFKVVGITGSAGKTTTREIVYHVLSRHFNCHQAIKSFNNYVGLPLTLLAAGAGHEIVVSELGSNAPGEIVYLADIARPDVAVITNVHPTHLEGFGSIEGIVEEKASISCGIRGDGVLLINADYPELAGYCSSAGYHYTGYGFGEDCQIRGDEPVSEGMSGRITIDGCVVEVPLCGRANLENTLAAWAVCSRFDISVEDFAAAVGTIGQVSMRLVTEEVGDVLLIDDSYNANPAAMRNALDCLERIVSDTGRRCVFVCGDMAELGADSERFHAELGEVIGGKRIDVLLAVGKFASTVAEAVRSAKGEGVEICVFDDTDALCDKLHDFVRSDDIILVKGSRSVKLEKAVVRLKGLFTGD